MKADYLAWKQVGNIFAAVDQFNVVTFWNSLTGKLIYKAKLDKKNQIKDATKCSRFEY